MMNKNIKWVGIIAWCSAALFAFAPTSARAQDSELEDVREYVRALAVQVERLEQEEHLEEAEQLLREILGLAERLEHHIARVEERHHRDHDHERVHDREHEHAVHQLEVMRIAHHGLLEAERRDAADLLEHTIHARELALESRRDEDAMHIRETAPDRGAQVDLLLLASEIWNEFGHEHKAELVADLAEEMAERLHEARREQGEREFESEREAAIHHIEVMRVALHALLEADRHEAAELLEHAIHARELTLENRRDEEAMQIRETAPGRGAQTELLLLASEIWQDFGHEQKAEMVADLAHRFMRRDRDHREHDGWDDDEREHESEWREEEEREERIEHLERRLDEMAHMMQRMHHMMEEMHDELRELEHDWE